MDSRQSGRAEPRQELYPHRQRQGGNHHGCWVFLSEGGVPILKLHTLTVEDGIDAHVCIYISVLKLHKMAVSSKWKTGGRLE